MHPLLPVFLFWMPVLIWCPVLLPLGVLRHA